MQPAGLPRTVQSQRVMPGLVPGIHAVQGRQCWEIECSGAAWMAGTSPAMTAVDCIVGKSSSLRAAPVSSDSPAACGERVGVRGRVICPERATRPSLPDH